MKTIIFYLFLFSFTAFTYSQTDKVTVVHDKNGIKLVVGGKDFMINGMNWDYFPIGTNYSYSLWNQTDAFIKQALDDEMSLLKDIGVNSIRVYEGIQPKWIRYIYENYGIYTMLNHAFGRYGISLNSTWVSVTNYSDQATQKQLLSEVTKMVEDYKNTPGLLLFLLGNENNYGLFWAGAETEDFPDEEEKKRGIGENRGRSMYKLMNTAALKMKAIHGSNPIAICNGDLLFLDIIAEECKDVDIFGVNMYRGISFGDAFQKVKEKLDKPIMFTEFGADAFHAIKDKEDQKMQSYYNLGNWQEIYENAAGLGKSENSIGGYTFQFSDGWWKHGQTKHLEVQDKTASWANAGYKQDYKSGKNNMNEEWFGICAKGPTSSDGFYKLYPRSAYYVLKEIHKIKPYSEKASSDYIHNAFKNIQIRDASELAINDKSALEKTQKQQ